MANPHCEKHVFRTEWRIHAVWFLVCVPMYALLPFVAVKAPLEALKLFAAAVAVEATFHLYMAGFWVAVSSTSITVARPFARKVELPFSDISRASAGQGTSMLGYTIRLTMREPRAVVEIFVKPFSRVDIARLASAVVERAPNAAIDGSLVALTKGRVGVLVPNRLALIVRVLGLCLFLALLATLWRMLE